MMAKNTEINWSCPIPLQQYPNILLGHGSGGKLMHELLENLFLPAFRNKFSEVSHDCVYLPCGDSTLAFTTDSYVINPLFFPGGNIGTLAVNGTINDLAMGGARPLYLSAAFILEEGLPIETLARIVHAMRDAARSAGVQLVTGDTKVVDKGKGDHVFINTAGIGLIEHDKVIAPQSVAQGDAVVLSGDIGRHGIAVMAKREGLEFETTIQSDCCALTGMVQDLLDAGIDLHCLRDCTRGGLATTLIEIAEVCQLSIEIDEAAIPVEEAVRGACEVLGLDPLYVANEGRFIAFVPADHAESTVEHMRQHPAGRQACIIGTVARQPSGQVTLKGLIGMRRIVTMLAGEQLPRIC